MKIFTIGHSNHTIETFIELLHQHQVTALADVRSSPYSRRFPQFNQSALKTALKTANIAYVPLGDNLGARPRDRNCYINGMARYDLIAATEAFKVGLNRLIQGSEKYQISLMCAEQDPIVCHRAILICPHLKNAGLEIHHIHKNGDLESNEDLENRVLKQNNLYKLSADLENNIKQLSLFDLQPIQTLEKPLSRAELVEKAYQLQSEKVAYTETTDDD
ncbi:DUF488 family protein [Dolichospermum circinale]|uniref:DUF488 domain-containing protein n=1 Tax=Dolichospermum circinale TaxID=109265 RepID=UPI00232DA435|nr:DUF488 domain-containing protein [Dolichospermum circinale]MDB9453657.1 DUF488 domain-containing protein [Dolichospermum circinale CS-541/06]MDB9462695.1 DUF488 domain-containing protein [Dolichospermum circinale CS-541/04]MDB9549054.1 DUF488 domain-containing protein [Dolichospermum circinale CS-1031]